MFVGVALIGRIGTSRMILEWMQAMGLDYGGIFATASLRAGLPGRSGELGGYAVAIWRLNDRRVGVGLLGLEMFAGSGAASGCTRTGNGCVRLTLAERVMTKGLVSLAVTARAVRFFVRIPRPRMLDLSEAWFELSKSVAPRRAMQLLAAESASAERRAAVRVGGRAVVRDSDLCVAVTARVDCYGLGAREFQNFCERLTQVCDGIQAA